MESDHCQGIVTDWQFCIKFLELQTIKNNNDIKQCIESLEKRSQLIFLATWLHCWRNFISDFVQELQSATKETLGRFCCCCCLFLCFLFCFVFWEKHNLIFFPLIYFWFILQLQTLTPWLHQNPAPSLDKKTRHVILKPTFWPPGPLSMLPGWNQSSLSAQQQPRVTAKMCCGYRQFLSEGVLLQQCWTCPPTGTLLSSEQHYLVVCVQVFFSDMLKACSKCMTRHQLMSKKYIYESKIWSEAQAYSS